jgi:hypothetical protein
VETRRSRALLGGELSPHFRKLSLMPAIGRYPGMDFFC